MVTRTMITDADFGGEVELKMGETRKEYHINK